MRRATTHLENASAAEHYALRFPYRKSVRIRRDLKHFDEWVRATFNVTIDAPLPLAFLYKAFFLSHIALYPSTAPRDRLLPDGLSREFQQSGLIDAGVLSCRQVAVRILSVIRWQHYQFKVNTRELMRELVPFYHRLCKMTQSQELTYKLALHSATVLQVFRLESIPSPYPERDLVILLMTWSVGCTPEELIQLSFDDIDLLDSLDWVYFRQETPVKLDPMTVLSIISLIDANKGLMGSQPDRLLNCRDGAGWQPLVGSDIEAIIERHYRFAGTLWGFAPYISPFGRQMPDLLPSEEALFADAVGMITKRIVANAGQSPTNQHDDEHDNWDIAVLKKAGFSTSAEQETREANEDQQIDWDAAITKPK